MFLKECDYNLKKWIEETELVKVSVVRLTNQEEQ